MLESFRNEVNGGVTQINPGGYPNSAYWLRMDRVGNVFRFYQRTNSTDAWRGVSFPAPVSGTNLTRSDLGGLPLQVGIIHATFNNQLGVQFSDSASRLRILIHSCLPRRQRPD